MLTITLPCRPSNSTQAMFRILNNNWLLQAVDADVPASPVASDAIPSAKAAIVQDAQSAGSDLRLAVPGQLHRLHKSLVHGVNAHTAHLLHVRRLSVSTYRKYRLERTLLLQCDTRQGEAGSYANAALKYARVHVCRRSGAAVRLHACQCCRPGGTSCSR